MINQNKKSVKPPAIVIQWFFSDKKKTSQVHNISQTTKIIHQQKVHRENWSLSAPPAEVFSFSAGTFLPFLATVKRRRKLMPGAEIDANDAIPMQVWKKVKQKSDLPNNGDEKNAGESQESWQNNTNYILSCSFIQNLKKKSPNNFRESQSSSWGKRIPGVSFIKGFPTREPGMQVLNFSINGWNLVKNLQVV